jgi:hypothetical protein
MNRRILNASEGMILTNGEICGVQIYLADGVDATAFHEIPMTEYEEMLAKQNEEMSSE